MLGEKLEDPEGVEEGGSIRGMGLLPVTTVFREEKHRTRVTGYISESFSGGIFDELAGNKIEGYEIHMGETSAHGRKSADRLCSISVFGKEPVEDGYHTDNVFGTYVHGIFDTPEIAAAIVRSLAASKGLDMDDVESLSAEKYKEMQYDKLAGMLRENLDMKKIYEILEVGV